jgi:hypothetical protein
LKTNEPMTISQPFRKFAGLAAALVLFATLAACSGNDVTPETSGTAGSSSGAGSSGTGNATAGSHTGTAGSNATAGAGTAGSNTSAGAGSDTVVGTFQVQVLAADDDPTTGMTKVVGQVSDGPVPSNVIWTETKKDGGCHLETPTVPFCAAGCAADVCVADDVCQAYPVAHTVGAVTLKGVKLVAGGTELPLKEIAHAYQPTAGTALAFPPFTTTDDITLQAAGGDYAAFELSAKGVDPLSFTSTDFELEDGKPLVLTWDGATDPKSSQMHLKLDISHHGGVKGIIECDGDDTGTLTISAAMISELLGLGVAGFPSVVLSRLSLDTARIAPGLVKLEVSARTEHYVTVKGVDSCNVTEDCPKGKTCATDSTCQ